MFADIQSSFGQFILYMFIAAGILGWWYRKQFPNNEPGEVLVRPLGRDFKGVRVAWFKDLGGVPFDARVRIYSLRPEPMSHLKEWLEQTEQLWAAQLVAFKTHVERGS